MRKITLTIVGCLVATLLWSGCGGGNEVSSEEAAADEAQNAANANQAEAEKMAKEAEQKAKEIAEQAEAQAKKAAQELQNK